MIEYVNKQTVLNLFATHDGNHLYRAIQNLTPSNAKEPRYAEWLTCGRDKRGYADTFECSLCGNLVQYAYRIKDIDYDFCPNCGADMREEEE